MISRPMKAGLVPDGREQVLWARGEAEGLVHYSDRDSQYLAIDNSERLIEAGILCLVRTKGDWYVNALVGSAIGLFNAEVNRFRGPWKYIGRVEDVSLGWMD